MAAQDPFWKNLAFRVVAATLIPVLVLLALEGLLRGAGLGYSTAFFLPGGQPGSWVTNPRFGWRFFPRLIARAPPPQVLGKKDPDGFRIFVLGGSAAMGTPDPSFGLAPVLEVLLRAAHPGMEIEVKNAAMVAINSLVVAEIARECVRYEPDLFVVYLGNNEVVGPYGPGTVFGGHSPGTWTMLRLPSLRLAQLLERSLSRFRASRELASWRGMEMFVDRRVPAHDLRLDVVRKRLRSNLLRIRRLAEDSGAQVVFSTVAVNLRQSPPFLSVHDERLDAGMLATWKEAFQRGRDKLSSSDLSGARKAFQQALDLDDGVAEAHYLLGQAFLASQRLKEAQNHFRKARDLDALRFRADSSINEIIRQVAGPDLVDAEAILGAASSVPGLPGRELFFEHVHLRFQGTYLLAQALAEAIGTRLPLPPATSPRLSSRECAQRLALTSWDQARSLQSILNMVRRPPFTHQSGHEETVLGLHQELLSSRGRARTRGDETLKAFRLALQNRAHDVYLRDRYTELLQEEGLFHEAIEQLEALLELDPQSPRWRTRLGFVLADQGHTEEARKLLSGLLADFPDMEGPYLNLGTLLLQSDDLVGAESVHRKGLARLPLSVTLRLGLGHVLEKAHRPREARDLYLEILDLDPGSAQAHLRLAELHDKAGAWKDAQREYRAALALDPLLVTAHNNLGLILEKQGFLDQAIVAYDQAIEVDPYYALAHFNLADALFLAGETSEAISSYRAALELDPENSQGRHNLALALAQERQQKTLSQGTAPTP